MYKFTFAFCILACFYCSCINIAVVVLAQQQQNDDTLSSSSNNPTTVAMNNNNEPDPTTTTSSPKTLPTNNEDIDSNNNHDSQFISSSSTTTTSVLTHFSMPSRVASSSTSSSFHPIPSAPYPDDIVGKHGPLHTSSANDDSNILYQGIIALTLIVSSTLLLVKNL